MNLELSFSESGCHTKVKELPLLYHLLIAGEEYFDLDLTVYGQRKMQTASSKIWIQVAVSISYDGNHYTKSAFKNH